MTSGATGEGSARWASPVWLALAVLLVLAPTLAAGYVLTYDMVFTPRQDLLPAALGLSGGLPRAVPQDAVVALLTAAVPGWLVQKAALVGALLAAGLGTARLVRGRAWWVGALAGTHYVWNAWVAERLVLGHWGLLVAYGVLPWAVAAALDVRRGRGGAVRLVLLCALAALTPTGGVLVAVVAVPIAVGPRSRAAVRARWLTAVVAVMVNAPWWLPSVLHPAVGASDPDGAVVFGLRPEGPWGVLLTALGLGGLWNADAVPVSRSWWTAPLAAVVLVALAVLGGRAAVRLLGRAGAGWLAVTAGAGLVLAVVSGWSVTRPAAAWVVTAVPGTGLLRDGQKWLAPLALLLSLAASLGVARVLDRVRDLGARGALVALALAAPLLVLPDLAWGVAGRLQPVDYPPEWSAVRERVAPGGGDVAVLPWAAFRAFEWNDRRTVLDPAPRWLQVPAVVDDTLVVARGDTLVTVSGEDPRATAIGTALAEGRPLATVLPGLGVGWVLVEREQPPGVPAGALDGLVADLSTGELQLWRVDGPVSAATLPGYAAVVVAADLAVAALLAALVARQSWAAVTRRRRAARPRAHPAGRGS